MTAAQLNAMESGRAGEAGWWAILRSGAGSQLTLALTLGVLTQEPLQPRANGCLVTLGRGSSLRIGQICCETMFLGRRFRRLPPLTLNTLPHPSATATQ